MFRTPTRGTSGTSSVSTPLPKKRKRKSIPLENRAYHPRQESRGSTGTHSEGLWSMRSDHTTEKTSVLYLGSPLQLNPNDKENPTLMAKLNARNADAKTHRPLAEITEFSNKGTPLKGKTPGGTHLHKILNLGSAIVFSNDENKAETATPTIDPNFNSTKIAPNRKKLKSAHYRVTAALTAAVAAKKTLNNGQRSQPQATVMAAAGVDPKTVKATEYSQAAGATASDVKSEFAHLQAYAHGGAKTQTQENIGVATAAANTVGMCIDSAIEIVAKAHPHEGANVTVKAPCIGNTHLLASMNYNIEAPNGKVLPLTINGQNPHKPPHALKTYTDSLASVAMVDVDDTPAPAVDNSMQYGSLYFKRLR